MIEPTGPDDVETSVGGVEPDADAAIETARYIDQSKKRPEYPRELEAAERLLADLGIRSPGDGMRDADSLLVHWRRCVADLNEADARRPPSDSNLSVAR